MPPPLPADSVPVSTGIECATFRTGSITDPVEGPVSVAAGVCMHYLCLDEDGPVPASTPGHGILYVSSGGVWHTRSPDGTDVVLGALDLPPGSVPVTDAEGDGLEDSRITDTGDGFVDVDGPLQAEEFFNLLIPGTDTEYVQDYAHVGSGQVVRSAFLVYGASGVVEIRTTYTVGPPQVVTHGMYDIAGGTAIGMKTEGGGTPRFFIDTDDGIDDDAGPYKVVGGIIVEPWAGLAPGDIPDLSGDYEAAGAVAAHEAESDPHPEYLTPAEADATYDPLGAGTSAAASAVAAHVGASDPHPQYLTPAEGAAAYSAIGHTHAWADVSKTGSSLADLATRSASDLTTGTLSPGRLPTFTGDVESSGGSAVLSFRLGAATTVLGRSAGTTGVIADIAASSDDTYLGRRAGTLTWAGVAASKLTGSQADATMSANQGVTASVWTTVALDTESADSLNEYNTGTYTFTPAVTGTYLVCYFCHVASAAARNIASVWVGTASEYRRMGDAVGNHLGSADVMVLTGGTGYTFRVFPTGASPTVLSGAHLSRISIRRVF